MTMMFPIHSQEEKFLSIVSLSSIQPNKRTKELVTKFKIKRAVTRTNFWNKGTAINDGRL